MSYLGNGVCQSKVEILGGASIGTIAEFIRGKVDPSYLLCDGNRYDENIYRDLFTFLGTNTTPLITHDIPVGGVQWFPNRSAITSDFIPADGQLLKRDENPEAVVVVGSGKVPTVVAATWLSDASQRGKWVNDDPTWLRVPDLNGKESGSEGALFLRGDGKNASSDAGGVQGDCIRNFKGSLSLHGGERPSIIGGMSGVIVPSREHRDAYRSAVDLTQHNASGINSYGGFDIDASRVVPTGAENRPVAVTGVWAVRVKTSTVFAIKAFGSIANEGSADLAALAAKTAKLESELEKTNTKVDKNLGKWHKSGTSEFNRYFSAKAPWSFRTDECAFIDTGSEIRIRGIVRGDSTGGAIGTFLTCLNPNKENLFIPYSTIFPVQWGLSATNNMLTQCYIEPSSSTDGGTVTAHVGSTSIITRSWVMFDLTFSKV